MKAILAMLLATTLITAATQANALRWEPGTRGFERPNYGYGEAYHGRFNRGNPDRNFYGPNVLHGPP